MSSIVSKRLRYSILERDGFACRACGAKNCLEIDHIVPRSKGGITVESNLQVLCADCNRGKSDSLPKEMTPPGVPLSDLEARWSLSRNAIKARAEMLGVRLIIVSSTQTLWPQNKLKLGDEFHVHITENKTTSGFHGKKKTSQFNIRVDTDVLAQFRNRASQEGEPLGLDRHQSLNRALHIAMRSYIQSREF